MPHCPALNLHLECYPAVPEHVSMPWDAADEYLVETLPADQRCLIINDRYGALACALPGGVSYVENASARYAAEQNAQRNDIDGLQFTTVIDAAALEASADLNAVVVRIPKNFDQLHYWLWLCQQALPVGTPIWLAGMSKHIPVKWLNWLEANADGYQQLKQQRKARLLKISNSTRLPKPALDKGYTLDDVRLTALPGVFGRANLDPGARFLIDTLKQLPELLEAEAGTVCDLGCGNGVLGNWLARNNANLTMIQTDDHWPSVESARANAIVAGVDITVHHGDCLEHVSGNLDLVLCNPPFHDGHKQLDNIARNMFEQSAAKLADDGQLIVVANRHLKYKPALSALFGSVEQLAGDTKFNVWLAANPKRQADRSNG